MRTILRRGLSLLLITVLCFSLVPTSSFAAEPQTAREQTIDGQSEEIEEPTGTEAIADSGEITETEEFTESEGSEKLIETDDVNETNEADGIIESEDIAETESTVTLEDVETKEATLKIEAEEIEYTIEFDANGGSGPVPATIKKRSNVDNGIIGRLDETVPTKEGCTFYGWSASPEWNSKRVAGGWPGSTQAPDGTRAVMEGGAWTYADYCYYSGGNSEETTLRLYAQWAYDTEFIIEFDANGGTGPVPETMRKRGKYIGIEMGLLGKEVPTREGYTFCGWSATPEWNRERIAYDRDYEYGGISVDGTRAAVMASAAAPLSFQNYCSWSGGEQYKSGMVLKLYAQWYKNKEYTIEFDVNGGYGAVPEVIKNSGVNANIEMGRIGKAEPKRTGYKFYGWSANPEWNSKRIYYYTSVPAPDGTISKHVGTSLSYSHYCRYTGGNEDELTLKLYAQWWSVNERTYTIEFDANGGSGPVPETIRKIGNTESVLMGGMGNEVPTREGYSFYGWSASPEWNNKRIAYSSSTGGSQAPDGTTGQIVGTTWRYADYCNYSGRNFAESTLKLYAQWVEDPEYTIEFDANGGNGIPETIKKRGTNDNILMGAIGSTVPTRAGYIFYGWSASPEWSSKRIAYSGSTGGSQAPDGTTGQIVGTTWRYSDYCKYSGGNNQERTLKLYAQWMEGPEYTIIFDANGGNGVPETIKKKGTSPSINMGVLGNSVPKREGYVFFGWSASPDWSSKRIAYSSGTGGTRAPDGTSAVLCGTRKGAISYAKYCQDTGGDSGKKTLRLYAQWYENPEYTIEFDANGGSGAVPETIKNRGFGPDVGMGIIGNSVPKREGYVFFGWSASPEWSSKRIAYSSITGGTRAPDGTSAVLCGTRLRAISYAKYCQDTGGDSGKKTLRLYAQWYENPEYTIEFDANGGSGAVPETIKNRGFGPDVGMGIIGNSVPKREGYVFFGWSASPDWSSKRIAYNSITGGTRAPDGTSAVLCGTRLRAISYAKYCQDTGGDSGKKTLRLYAQWYKTR